MQYREAEAEKESFQVNWLLITPSDIADVSLQYRSPEPEKESFAV